MTIAKIGKCIGCNSFGRTDEDGVCFGCLYNPNRGKSWAVTASRVRQDPSYALAVYNLIKTDAGRQRFIDVFGLPSGANAVGTPIMKTTTIDMPIMKATPRLRLVR